MTYYERQHTLRVRKSRLIVMQNRLFDRWYGLGFWLNKALRARIDSIVDRLEQQLRRNIASTHEWEYADFGVGKKMAITHVWICNRCQDLSLRWPDPPETYRECELTPEILNGMLDPDKQCHGCLYIYSSAKDRIQHGEEHMGEDEQDMEESLES